MFGSKKKEEAPKPQQEEKLSVATIPEAFYGGKDPVIFHAPKESKKKEEMKGMFAGDEKKKEKPEIQKKEVSTPVAPQAEDHKMKPVSKLEQPKRPAPPHGEKSGKGKWIIGIIILLFGTGGIIWYYLNDAGYFDAPEQTPPPAPPVVVDIPEPPILVEDPDPTPTTTPEVEEPEPLPEVRTVTPIVYPERNIAPSTDLDGDGVTDIEEEIFNTDSGFTDTDSDGYIDRREIINLYNPSGTAPMLLVDSGFVREYINPVWQYRVYHPAAWRADSVDDEQRQVLISAVSGEFIEVRILPRDADESFLAWFVRFGQNERITNYTETENRFSQTVWRRNDGLVAFIPTDNAVYSIIYQAAPDAQILYPTVMEMMLQSFRPTRQAMNLPVQRVLPEAPSSFDAPEEATSTLFADDEPETATSTIPQALTEPEEDVSLDDEIEGLL